MRYFTSPYNFVYRENRKVKIYDTTLRDGEQTPGVKFTKEQKVEIARKLDEVGIHEIEAGFPVISSYDEEAVKAVVMERLNARILALCRPKQKDIDAALRAEVEGVIIFLAVSDLHLKYKLKMDLKNAIDMALWAVEYAKDHGLFVQLTAEDATRTTLDSLLSLYKAAIDHGAERIGIADTAGCIRPKGMAYLVGQIRRNFDIEMSVHCHNDFGLAVANSLAAYEAGIDAISVSVNGLGERCGNAALEEVVMCLYALYGVDLNFRIEKLRDLSLLVSKFSGIPIPVNKAIVGENAFRHESGIHVAAVLKHPFTYEPYDPQLVGQERKLVFGRHSGTEGVKEKLLSSGLNLSDEEIAEIVRRLKSLPIGHKIIENSELIDFAKKVLEEKK
ncbi:MAG: homocitrate synthase family protein [Candidatus Methanomethyliaceae archaeon]|nr:homocitrate synthase family protein [Candidatus Methanomethyliaceae archaeon]MDW7970278.1 homocitrate synthase family protein [Nitrososphaerota archaeon]